jgi:hemerythrin-like metal-binding protein
MSSGADLSHFGSAREASMLDQLVFHHLLGSKLGDILDRQHMIIKRKHQDVRTAILHGGGMERIIASSKELISATVAHFESEERAMESVSLRDFIAHKDMHADIVESLEDISHDLEQRRISGAMELLKFFESRIVYHLDVEDAALERELKG